MDAANFKTNFIGKDGFVWWIGQIAPEDVWLENFGKNTNCLLYTSPSPRDRISSRMPSSA